MNFSNRTNFKSTIQNDNVFVNSEVKKLFSLTGLPNRKGLNNAIVSNGEIVNIVSDSYGHLPNEKYFNIVEVNLINADINYITRSINRNNASFAVDYILNDENFNIIVKNGNDVIKPMLRFTNSYDGSCKTSGHFGFYRQICSNGLHVASSKIGFSVKHSGNITQFVLPEIKNMIHKFIDNEYYSLQRKFESMANTPIFNVDEFIKDTAEKFNLFKFESSEKNPNPSLNARLVKDIIVREGDLLKQNANLWFGYNAFNEVLHDKLKKPFGAQKEIDNKIFDYLLASAN